MRTLSVLLFIASSADAYELVAHRGVHQTYHRDGLTDTTCTAIRLEETEHSYIENTLESIEEAFKLGATMVELDVHPTAEEAGSDDLVVFHDWTLDCRTDASCKNGCKCNKAGECITHRQPWSYLKTLDIGHGYSYDEGLTFPFRGRHVARMPRFQDVLDLLDKYTSKKILVNVKGNKKRTALAFLKTIQSYPISTRMRLYYPYKYGYHTELEKLGVENEIDQADKKCLFKYLKTGWYGHFPPECHNKRIFIPMRETLERLVGTPGKFVRFTSILWGWPHRFIDLAHEHGTEVYASQVDSEKEFKEIVKLNLDGFMTNKIELIAPLYFE